MHVCMLFVKYSICSVLLALFSLDCIFSDYNIYPHNLPSYWCLEYIIPFESKENSRRENCAFKDTQWVWAGWLLILPTLFRYIHIYLKISTNVSSFQKKKKHFSYKPFGTSQSFFSLIFPIATITHLFNVLTNVIYMLPSKASGKKENNF